MPRLSEVYALFERSVSTTRMAARLSRRSTSAGSTCATTAASRRARPTYANGELAAATADSLQLFLNEPPHPLLTGDEEVELAKRIERGDPRRSTA